MDEYQSANHSQWECKCHVVFIQKCLSRVIGDIKVKSGIHLARTHGERKWSFVGQNFWARGYFVSTVGRDEETVRQYIRKQETENRRLDQLKMWSSEQPPKGGTSPQGRVSDPAQPPWEAHNLQSPRPCRGMLARRCRSSLRFSLYLSSGSWPTPCRSHWPVPSTLEYALRVMNGTTPISYDSIAAGTCMAGLATIIVGIVRLRRSAAESA